MAQQFLLQHVGPSMQVNDHIGLHIVLKRLFVERQASKHTSVGQAFQMTQVVYAETKTNHGRDQVVHRQAACRTIIVQLVAPVAVPLHRACVYFIFPQVSYLLRQETTVAESHMAPLVGIAGRQLSRSAPYGLDNLNACCSHRNSRFNVSGR